MIMYCFHNNSPVHFTIIKDLQMIDLKFAFRSMIDRSGFDQSDRSFSRIVWPLFDGMSENDQEPQKYDGLKDGWKDDKGNDDPVNWCKYTSPGLNMLKGKNQNHLPFQRSRGLGHTVWELCRSFHHSSNITGNVWRHNDLPGKIETSMLIAKSLYLYLFPISCIYHTLH